MKRISWNPTLFVAFSVVAGALFFFAPPRSMAATADIRWVAAATHAPGAAGALWRTDVSVMNPCNTPVTVDLHLHRSEGVASRTVTIDPGSQHLLPDVVASLISSDATGSLEVSPSAPVMVFSRTYNLSPTGTFGQSLDGIASSAGIGTGAPAYLLQLFESPAYRTNIGVLNMGSSAAGVDIHLMTAAGSEAGVFHLDVPAGLLVQDSRPFLQRFGLSDITGGFARIEVTSGSGVWAFASVIDNSTGDPTTVVMKEAAVDCSTTGGNSLTVTLPGNVPMTLLNIAAGSFTMGSPATESGRTDNEGPQHLVTISKDFWLGETEVTQAQWTAVMGSNPSSFRSCGGDCPVEQVSWSEVCGGPDGTHCTTGSFVGRLNAIFGTSTFRPPTEAEWEFAARAATISRFSFPEDPPCANGCAACSSADASVLWCANSASTPHPVRSKNPNPLGLYGMHGNVAEWVADFYGPYGTSAATDPAGPATGTWRVERSGSWYDGIQSCRSASRTYALPDYRKDRLGFRVAKTY